MHCKDCKYSDDRHQDICGGLRYMYVKDITRDEIKEQLKKNPNNRNCRYRLSCK